MSWIVTSVFRGGTCGYSGCGGWVPSGFGGDCAGVFPVIFVLYLNYLSSEISSSTPSISSP